MVRDRTEGRMSHRSTSRNRRICGAVMKKFSPVSRPDHPLARGDEAPQFELIDPTAGDVLRSPELRQAGPVLLTFYRGAWCGCCETDLRDLALTLPHLEARNVNVLGVFHNLDKEAN